MVVPHAGLAGYEGAWVWLRGETCIVSVPSDRVERVASRAVGADSRTLHTPEALRSLFGGAIERTIGPAWWGSVPPAGFRPAPSPEARKLGERDRALLAALEDACSAEEWSASGIGSDSEAVFACPIAGRLASACAYRRRAVDVGDPGVVTHPAHRGGGYGRSAVGAATAHGIGRGDLVLYQTLAENRPARAVASALGYEEVARHVAVRFRPAT